MLGVTKGTRSHHVLCVNTFPDDAASLAASFMCPCMRACACIQTSICSDIRIAVSSQYVAQPPGSSKMTTVAVWPATQVTLRTPRKPAIQYAPSVCSAGTPSSLIRVLHAQGVQHLAARYCKETQQLATPCHIPEDSSVRKQARCLGGYFGSHGTECKLPEPVFYMQTLKAVFVALTVTKHNDEGCRDL